MPLFNNKRFINKGLFSCFMGSHGHLELILEDGTARRAEVYCDGPAYVVWLLQELAIRAGRENKSISYLNLQEWFNSVVKTTDSKVTDSYEIPSASYCRIDQRERRIDVDSFFVYDGDKFSEDRRRLVVDLENPHNLYGFAYDPKSLKASLKVLGRRDAVFWKDEVRQDFYSDKIDAPVPFKVQGGELLLIDSISSNQALFEFDGVNFKERQYSQ